MNTQEREDLLDEALEILFEANDTLQELEGRLITVQRLLRQAGESTISERMRGYITNHITELLSSRFGFTVQSIIDDVKEAQDELTTNN